MPDRLQTLIAATFGISTDAVNDELEFGVSPNWDSLNHVNLMLALEDAYGLPAISDDAVVELTTVRAIREYLNRPEVLASRSVHE